MRTHARTCAHPVPAPVWLSPQVSSCAWVPDGCQLFTGSKCGVITAYSNRFTNTTVGSHGNVPW